MNDQPILEAFNEVVNLALALGVRDIKKFPACWEHRVDEHWVIAVNGHNETMLAGKLLTETVEVPPFNCYIEFNGFPFGFMSPYGGTLGAGAIANEDSFIAALRRAQELAKGEKVNA